MEQLFYKIRLQGGRVIGPVDIERIKLFIANDKITGIETARLYPTGEWRDINTFPDISAVLLDKLSGNLKVSLPKTESQQEIQKIERESAQEPAPESAESVILSSPSVALVPDPGPAVPVDDEKTVIRTANDERTVIKPFQAPRSTASVKVESQEPTEHFTVNKTISTEKTAMLSRPVGEKNDDSKKKNKKKIFIAIGALIAALLFLLPDEKPKKANVPKFSVQMPTFEKQDPQQSDKVYKSAFEYYTTDSVDGYKKSAALFLKSASMDTGNAKALCMLASSYLNLIDVINRDENYFSTVTRLIEMARAKGIDLSETVIADVELYLALGNADAAMNRVVEFTKTHQYGAEMYYYIAATTFAKNDNENAMKSLGQIDSKNWFTAKIPYLYGLIFEKEGNREEALKAFNETVKRSPTHIKARVHLIEHFFGKDNLAEAAKHADYVIENQTLGSALEVGKAYYFRARMHEIGNREDQALSDLEAALKKTPEEPDYLLEFYTLKARMGSKIKDAAGKAKMFDAMAKGERALKAGDLGEAHKQFLTARQVQENDPIPLVRLAEVLKRRGDMQSARMSLEKAVKMAPGRADLYPKFIRTLIDTYSFEDAKKNIETYKGLNASGSVLDRLYGDLYFKQQRLREAQVYYKRAVGDSSADSTTYTAYADILFAGSAFREAAFYYGLALRFDPFNVTATIGTAKSLAELDGVQVGTGFLDEALRKSPRKAEITNGMAELFHRKGDYANALKTVDQAISYDNEMAIAYKTKGDVLSALDKYKEALDAYLTYANYSPGDPAGHIERYKLFLKKLDLKSAKESIQNVIDAYPRYPGAYNMLGELFKEAKNYNSAFEAAKQEIQFNPGYLPAYVLATAVLNAKGDYNTALGYINRALKADPNYVPALIQAGDTNRLMKSYGAAGSLLQRALGLDQGNPQIHKRLGLLYIETGDRQRAQQHIRAYTDLYPDAPDRSEMEKYLNR